MQKEKFIKIFTFSIIFVVIVFLVDLFFGFGIFGLKQIVFANFQDYLADFINHARLASDEYVYRGADWSLAERGLPPMEYCLFGGVQKAVDYNIIPTLFLSGGGLSAAFSKAMFLANYLLCVVSVLFFVYLYENLNLEKKYIKFLIILSFLVSTPFIFYFERGNSVILSVFTVSFFMFNYNSANRVNRELSFWALAFACALKLIPSLFAIILLFRKRYKDFVKVLVYSLLLFFGAFLFLKGGLFNFPLFIKNFICSCNTYKYGASCKFLTFLMLIMYFCIPVFKDEWKKFCSVVMLIMAFNSFYGYRMLYFFPVTVLFLNKTKFEKSDIWYGMALLLIICPIKFVTLFGYIILCLQLISEIVKYFYSFIKNKSIKQ